MSNSPPREPRAPPKSASAPAKLPLKGMRKPLSTETPQRDLHRRLYMKDYNKTYKGKQSKAALSAAKAAADLSRARLDFALNQADVEADCFFGLVGMNHTRSNNMASISSQALMSPGSSGGASHHHYQQSFHTYGSPPPHSPAPYGNPPIMSPQGNGRAYYYHHHNNANMYSGTPPPAYAQNYDQPSHHMHSNTMHSLHVSPAASRRAYRHPNNANNAAPRRHHAPTGFNEQSGNGDNSNRQRSSIVQDDDDVMSLGEEQPQESIDVPLEEEASEMEEEPQEVAVQGKKRVRRDDEEQLQPASSKKRKVEQQEPVVADEQSTATDNERALVFAADDTESIPVADDDNDDDDDDDAVEIGGIDGDQQEPVLADKQSAAANNIPVADDIDDDDDDTNAAAADDDAMEIGGIDDNAAADDDAMEIGGIDGDETVAELQPADQQFVAPPEHDGREIFPVSNEEELQITPPQAMLPLGAGPGLFGSPNRGPRGQRILNEAGRWGDPRDPHNREIAQNIVDAEDREDAGNMDRAPAVAGMAQQHRIHAGQMAVAAAQADQSEADRAQRQAELEAQNIRDLRARIKEEKGEGWTWSLLLTSLHFIMAIGKILWNRVVDFSDYYCLSVWAWNPINHLLVNSPSLATAFWFLTNAIGFTRHTYETVKEYFVWAKGASQPEPDPDGGDTCYFDTFVVVAFFCFFLWAFKWLVPESMQNVVAGGILMLVSVIKFLAVGEENADHEQFLRKSPVVFAVVSFLVSWCFLLSRFNKFLKGNPTFEELQEHLDTFNERNENFGFIQVCYVSIVFLLIFFDIV